MAAKTPVVTVFQGTGGARARWHWRLRGRNGEIVADGAQGYTRRGDARRAAFRAKQIMAEAVILSAKIIA